ncbi:Fasciclin-2 [Amphibalanus amphitrite]|uniref:Fasciclin-2 n=1 Tax=Amphibalanus amphitrite TaxID=1232801 RepID=A0A6A4VAH7_AMPAM|nr:Fasciclin-2 [Amphibalanus amphitrite]
MHLQFKTKNRLSLAQDSPRLELLPSAPENRRDIGASGYFQCKVIGQQEGLISDLVWTDPSGNEVPDERSSRVYSSSKDPSKELDLYVTNVTEHDSGEYTCRARYGNQEITNKFNLLVYMKIRWVDAPEEQNPFAGTRATIKCLVKANPPAIVEWLDGNGDFIRKTDRYTPLDSGLLYIENITSADDGEFLCRAKVPAEGEMSERRIKVEVYSRPEITLPVRDSEVEIIESQEGSIRCQATGKPEPERTWYGPSGTSAAEVPGLRVDGDGTLSFLPADRSMAGQYRCQAKNQVASVETTVNVVVIVRPEIVRYENVTFADGQSATLVCRVTGSPPPTVSFRKTGTDITYEKDVIPVDDRVMVRQTQEGDEQVGELSIRDLTRADSGTYDCVASNSGGQISAPARLTVQYQPVLTAPETPEVFTWAGHPAELRCGVEAEPRAEVGWSFGGRRPEEDVHMEQRMEGETSVLTVTPVDAGYFGVYQCSASNSQGSATLDFTLREATAPGLIHGAAVQAITSTTLEFSLPPPESDGGLPVHTYLVQYVQQGQQWDAALTREWPADGDFKVEELVPKQTYLFRFTAENEVGAGDWSEQLEQQMPKVDVPQPPTLVSADGNPVVAAGAGPDVVIASDESDSYQARWTAGADNGADIDNYQVSFRKLIYFKKKWQVVSSAPRRTSVVEMPGSPAFRLTGLKPDSYYRLEVRAHNEIGYSQPAQVIIHTAEGVAQEAAAAPVSRSSSLVVGVVIAVLLALVILCDLTCYAVNKRGITHMLCSRARGSSDVAKLTEEAASEKEPLQENGNGNKSSPPPPEANGERGAGDASEEEPLKIDKAQLDAAKDSAV